MFCVQWRVICRIEYLRFPDSQKGAKLVGIGPSPLSMGGVEVGGSIWSLSLDGAEDSFEFGQRRGVEHIEEVIVLLIASVVLEW